MEQKINPAKYNNTHQGMSKKQQIIAKPNQDNYKGENSLKIIPLGGCEEVGRNMTVFEYGQDIVILDMGLQFPEEDMPGVDFVIPNTEYLKGKEKNIRQISRISF